MSELAVGAHVQIQGLQSRNDLNGQRGVVIACDAVTGRIEVQLGGPEGEQLKIRPANATLVTAATAAATAAVATAPAPPAGVTAPPNGVARETANKVQSHTFGLLVGVQVEIGGLQSRADLNGRRGIIVAKDEGGDIFDIHLDGPGGGERVRCRRGNVVQVAAQPSVSAAVDLAAEHLKHQSRDRGPIAPPPPPPPLQGINTPPPPVIPPQAAIHPQHSAQQPAPAPRIVEPPPIVEPPIPVNQSQGFAGPRGDRDPDRTKTFPHASRFRTDQDRIQWFKAMNKTETQSYLQPQDSVPQPQFPTPDPVAFSQPAPATAPVAAFPNHPGPNIFMNAGKASSMAGFIPQAVPGQKGVGKVTLADGRTEDRSKDWVCKCGERNFMKRDFCHKCNAQRDRNQTGPNPSQEWDALCQEWLGNRSRSRGRRKKKKARGRKKRSSSSDSSSQSSRSTRKRRKKKKSSSSRCSSSGDAPRGVGRMQSELTESKGNPEIEKAKAEALQKLLKLKEEPAATRQKQWRALLREWHPDKHTENVEVATAVFQFLQKGKSLINMESK